MARGCVCGPRVLWPSVQRKWQSVFLPTLLGGTSKTRHQLKQDITYLKLTANIDSELLAKLVGMAPELDTGNQGG